MSKSNHHAPQKKYHHGNLRQALIDAGLELIAEGGISQIDLRKVARKAGVSHTAPYRHFSDKNELLVAIAEEGLRKLAEQVRHKLQQVPDGFLFQLEAFAKEYVHFAIRYPQLMREIINTDYNSYPALRQALLDLFVPLDSLLKQRQVTASNAVELTQLKLVILSMIHGFSTLVVENFNVRNALQGSEAIDSSVRLCVQTLYYGLEHDQL